MYGGTTKINLLFIALFLCFTLIVSETILVKEHILNNVKYPTSDLYNYKTLQEFFRIVEEKKMNLSIIISSKYENKDMSVMSTITTKFREHQLQESDSSAFSQDQTNAFLKTATAESLAAEIISTNGKETTRWTNKLDGISNTAAHQFLFNNTKFGNWNGLTYIGHYTFTIPNGAVGEEMTKIIDAHVSVNVVRKKNLSISELKQMKELIATNYYLYSTPYMFLKFLVETLDEHFPDYSWQGVSSFEEPFAISAKKYLWFEICGVDYLLFGE